MTNSPKEISAEGDFACEMKQHAMMEEAIASAGLAEEDTTPAWLSRYYSLCRELKYHNLVPRVRMKQFIIETRAEAVKEAIDHIYANLPFTTDRMENLIISKEKMREVLDMARGV